MARALALFLVFALAKAAAVWDSGLAFTPLLCLALLWQDALVALLFALADRWLLGKRASTFAYAALAAYAAVNALLVRATGTPLTVPMLAATGSAMNDSFAHYLTFGNAVLLVALLGLAGLLPRLRTSGSWLALPLLLVAAGGLLAMTGADTRGLHRNAVAALCTSAFPRVAAVAASATADWRCPRPDPDSRSLEALAGTAAGRDVLLFVLESAAAQYLQPFGGDADPMPRLTGLCREGLRFQAAYAVYPESIKGLVALQHGVHPALDTEPEDYAHVPVPSLAELLAGAGYRTALFHPGRFHFLGMEHVVKAGRYQHAADAAVFGGPETGSFGVPEETAVNAALAWIDSLPAGQRAFLSYLPIAGHHPYAAPPGGPFPNDTLFGCYQNAQRYADLALGQLVDGLRSRGRWQNTLLVVVGDHGQAFGQHPGNHGHTFQLYEENVRVPLVFAGPGLSFGGRSCAKVASHVDVPATVLDLLGLPSCPGHEGRSLLHPEQRRALLFTDYAMAWLGLREGPWKYVFEVETGRGRLFDLRVDPGERSDLAATAPDLCARYRTDLESWCASQRGRVASWHAAGR